MLIIDDLHSSRRNEITTRDEAADFVLHYVIQAINARNNTSKIINRFVGREKCTLRDNCFAASPQTST